MADPEYLGRIRAYLEQYREQYSQEALRAKLLSDGHSPPAVDLALAQVYGLEVAPSDAPPTPPTNTVQFVLTLVGTVLFNFVGLPLLAYATLLISDGAFSFSLIGFAVVLLAEIVAALVLRRRNTALARGLRWGVIVTVLPILLLVLLVGICIAVLANAGAF